MKNYQLSPFRKVGDMIFVSGQIGQKDGKLVSEDIEGQTNRAIANITEILKQNGLELKDVADVTAFITEQSDYEKFNEVYSKHFQEPYPARTTVTVKSLPLNARVELKVVASKELLK